MVKLMDNENNLLNTASKLALSNDIAASIPLWVEPQNRGDWFEKNCGYTGPAAMIDQELLERSGYGLWQFVNSLLKWRDEHLQENKHSNSTFKP